jgi:putative transposase
MDLLDKHFGCVRLLYNLGLTYRERAWENRVSVGYNECSTELTELKKEYSFLKEVNSQSLQATLRNLDTAYKGFFKKESGYPKYKSKTGRQSFTCPQKAFVIKETSLLHLPKFKSDIPIVLHRPIKGDTKSITISKTTTGKYFASILVETGVELPAKENPAIKRAIGVDVGLKDFATIGNINLSKVTKIDNPKYLRLDTEVLKRRQRQLEPRKVPKNSVLILT